MKLINWFPRKQKNADVKPDVQQQIERLDPLDYRHRSGSWADEDKSHGIRIRGINEFPLLQNSTATVVTLAGDSKDISSIAGTAMDGKLMAMDSCLEGAPCGSIGDNLNMNAYTVPEPLMAWYASQSFIGYQACALIAQHWLVDKACSMSGEDAIRNGWEIKASGNEVAISDEQLAALKKIDEKMNLTEEMKELNRFKNVFGIRILLFKVASSDPRYYEKPFNIDGITKGSYKGISQIDPYWTAPIMTAESTADPSGEHFYDPEFWIISGKKYHRSHLIIVRGPEPADLLKPTYIFGGIPLTQRIYERVYAAERTANEAPLLATNKRTTAIHVDMEKAVANQAQFQERLMMWIRYRDNHAVKVMGEDETMEQFDTSLSDFDSVIMNQFQLVASIARTPATKLLGTSPKGFNASGEYEATNYHEELESIQKHTMDPFLTRHYQIAAKSLGLEVDIQHVWEPVDSVSMQKRAELNKAKAELGQTLINGGVISPDEERNRIRDDKHSGYNRLQDDDANQEPGMSPENLAALEKVDADQEKAEAAQVTAGARAEVAGAEGGSGLRQAPSTEVAQEESLGSPGNGQKTQLHTSNGTVALLERIVKLLSEADDKLIPEGHNGTIGFDPSASRRSTSPGVVGSVRGSVDGPNSIMGEMPVYKLPKMKVHGMPITIENPRGTIRQGMDINGNRWSAKMAHHYGFLRSTKGADGDEMDCFIGQNPESQKVFVINQSIDGVFDEHKCMIGFNSADEAKAGYHESFNDGWDGFDSIVPMSVGQFKRWLSDGDCYSPLSAKCISEMTSTPQTN